MKTFKRFASIALCLAMLLATAAHAQMLDMRWSLGNIKVTLEDEEFLLGPQAHLDILQDEDGGRAHFEIDMEDDVLMPVSVEVNAQRISFSLGSRVYTLEFAAIGEILDLSEEDIKVFSQLGTMIESYGVMGMRETEYLRKYESTITRLYEIMVGTTARKTEVAVGDKILPAHLYAGEFKLVHLVDMLEYMKNCEVKEIAAFTQALLEMINTLADKDYITFSEPYYDGFFDGIAEDDTFGQVEMLIAYDDETIYDKTTMRIGEESVVTTETISDSQGTVINMSSEEKDDENDYRYSEILRIEIDGAGVVPDAIRAGMEYSSSYTDDTSAEDRSVTHAETGAMKMDIACADGLWKGELTMVVDTDSGYDYGDGPTVISENTVFEAAYAETVQEDGSILGSANASFSEDGDPFFSLSFDLNRGGGAAVETITGEGAKVFSLGADSNDMAYKLLQADVLSFAAQAAELYADEGIYGLTSYFNEESYEWPEELGDDLKKLYDQYFYGQWWEVYSFADARRIYKGSMPEYNAPEGYVLESIQAGDHNILMNYISNGSDFGVDVTHMGDTSGSAQSEAVEVTPADFTYVEEDGLVTMAYFYNGDDILVFFYFEEADRAQAEEIIAGLELKTKKVVLAA